MRFDVTLMLTSMTFRVKGLKLYLAFDAITGSTSQPLTRKMSFSATIEHLYVGIHDLEI